MPPLAVPKQHDVDGVNSETVPRYEIPLEGLHVPAVEDAKLYLSAGAESSETATALEAQATISQASFSS